MTVAVFAYFGRQETMGNDVVWLNRLMEASVKAGFIQKLVLFTNQPEIIRTTQPGIEVPQYKTAPRVLLVRQRYLRSWKKAAEEIKAHAVLCFGLNSFIATALPNYVFLHASKPVPVAKLQRLKGVQGIFCNTQWQQARVEQVTSVKTVVLPGGPFLEIVPQRPEEEVREQFAQGCAYFLYAGPVTDTAAFIILLKAFSRFKRRQKSSFKLVLLPSDVGGTAALRQALANYKYREEVVLSDMPLSESDTAALFAAAYLFVQPLAAAPYGVWLKEALAAGLPVVALQDEQTSELVQDAALYFEAGSDETLAAQLMLLYKDEALRGSLSAKAKSCAAGFSWPESARRLGEALAPSVK